MTGPGTATEKLVADVWCELLGVPEIDPEENFFALGGHSMLATQVVYRLEEETGIELELATFFDLGTVVEVAAELDRLQLGDEPDDGFVEGEL